MVACVGGIQCWFSHMHPMLNPGRSHRCSILAAERQRMAHMPQKGCAPQGIGTQVSAAEHALMIVPTACFQGFHAFHRRADNKLLAIAMCHIAMQVQTAECLLAHLSALLDAAEHAVRAAERAMMAHLRALLDAGPDGNSPARPEASVSAGWPAAAWASRP
eukprot:scaffold74067_cov21-Tisochrysis_lutea.AAC.2